MKHHKGKESSCLQIWQFMQCVCSQTCQLIFPNNRPNGVILLTYTAYSSISVKPGPFPNDNRYVGFHGEILRLQYFWFKHLFICGSKCYRINENSPIKFNIGQCSHELLLDTLKRATICNS